LVAAYERLDRVAKREVLSRHRQTFNEIEEMRFAFASNIHDGTAGDEVGKKMRFDGIMFDFLTADDINTIVSIMKPRVAPLMALRHKN